MKRTCSLLLFGFTIFSVLAPVQAAGKDWVINFESNGGAGVVEKMEVGKNDNITLPNDPYYKRGYAFRGWKFKNKTPGYTYTINYVSNTTGAKIAEPTTIKGIPNSQQMVTPKSIVGYSTPSNAWLTFDSQSNSYTFRYNPIRYNISYNLNGGQATNKTSYTIEDTFTLNNPTRTGYSFKGWSGTGISSYSQNVTVSKQTGARSYTANWDTNSYVLTFNANGGSVGETSRVLAYGAQYGNLPTPTRNGHKFLGWFTSPTGGNRVYSTTTIGSQSVTVYAHWEVSEFTITWNANGGSVYPTSSRHVAGNSIGILPTPTRTGHTFEGWYTSATGGSRIYDNQSMPYNNVTYYAHWSIKNYSYNINYKSSNGKILGSTTISGNAGSTQTIYAPNKIGYNTPNSKQIVFDSPTKNIEFIYNPISYRIDYYLNGGSAVNPVNYNIESGRIVLQQPTKAGHKFTGWTGSNGNIPQISVVINSGTTGNLNYTANWEATEKEVTIIHERMSVDGKRYEQYETEVLRGKPGDIIYPQVKTYKGFTSPSSSSYQISNGDNQTVTYRYTRNKYGIDLNLLVNGNTPPETPEAGYGDLYVNGQLFKAHINDYYHNDANGPTIDNQYFYYDSVIEFKNITANPGYILTSPIIVSIRVGTDTWANRLNITFNSSWVYSTEQIAKSISNKDGGWNTPHYFDSGWIDLINPIKNPSGKTNARSTDTSKSWVSIDFKYSDGNTERFGECTTEYAGSWTTQRCSANFTVNNDKTIISYKLNGGHNKFSGDSSMNVEINTYYIRK